MEHHGDEHAIRSRIHGTTNQKGKVKGATRKIYSSRISTSMRVKWLNYTHAICRTRETSTKKLGRYYPGHTWIDLCKANIVELLALCTENNISYDEPW